MHVGPDNLHEVLCLDGCLVGQLVGWLCDSLHAVLCLDDCLVGQLVGWFSDSLCGLVFAWLVSWLVGSVIVYMQSCAWTVGWLVL